MSDVQTHIDFTEDGDGNVNSAIIEHSQVITDGFLKRQEAMREWSKRNTAGEYHEVAAVPMAKIMEWKRQGFDAMEAPVREVVARLKAEQATAFLSSVKKI